MKIMLNDAPAKSYGNKSKSKYTHADKTEWLKQHMEANAKQLVLAPENIYYIDVSIYKQRAKKAERLTVNVDFIFAPGTKPFKTTANCLSRSRKRELVKNVKHPDWSGYQTALDALSLVDNGRAYAGKLKNRVPKYYALSRYIIPKTVVIVSKGATHHEVLIRIADAEYLIDCYPVNTSDKQAQYFTHNGSWQQDEETEYDFEV